MNTNTFDEVKLISKIRWRLIPYVMLLYIIAMLDRVNLGYAALQMNNALAIGASSFGLIAGIFFIAYFLFEVPSNVLMHKLGAKIWISRILISWGIVTILTGFVQSVTHLGILRFLLGLAEAGFYPGILLYLTFWFPARYMAKTLAALAAGMAIATIMAGPLSTWLLDNVTWYGLAGWRWMFILEGIPALLFGVLNIFIMTDRPEQATFLSKEEKDWLIAEMKQEHEAKTAKLKISKWAVLKNTRVWYLAMCYICYVCALSGLIIWMPQILKGLSKVITNTQVGLISMIPYICGVIAMQLNARHSDKTLERRYHVALPILVSFFSLIALTTTNDLWLSLFYICVSIMGIYCFVGTFWTLPALFLSEATAAVGLAMVNSIGNLGGFLGPYAVGFIKEMTGTTNGGMYFLASFALLGAIMVLAIPAKYADTKALKEG